MDKILKKIIRLTMLKELIQSFVIVLILLFFMSSDGIAQINAASPANWLYPDGNPEATRKIIKGSEAQTIDLFQVKWSSSSISGDIKPLIGNIIDNNRLIPEFMYAPNEIAGVIGGKLVVIDAKGKTHKRANLPPFSKNISMLIDTLASKISSNVTGLVALGIETVEYENLDDSLAYAYICSYEQSSDTVSILKRLAIDLRGFEPNIFASIKPIFCRRYASQFQIYGTVNMSKPIVSSPTPDTPPFFRGITQFNTRELKSFYPMSVIGDDTLARKMVGPEVSFSQPSIGVINSNMQRILLPIYPSNDLDVMIENPNSTNQTFADRPYLISMDMDGTVLKEAEIHLDLSSIISISDTRPQIRPYFVNIRDANNSDSVFILVAEEYRGVEGSIGTAKIHLFDNLGGKLSAPIEQIQGADISPSYEGDKNHLWSVAVGNLDGNNSNALIPNYPNNRGNEIILTQSTREFVVAASKLIVMRYFSGNKVPKKSPPDTYLNEFDTICTFRINGWLAAVNDIDGADDGKDEIMMVDGSKLRILRMNDYKDYSFRDGKYFDTVKTFNFLNETIQNVAVADLEGDGRNDLIVTTNDSTYIVGIKLYDRLDITYPLNSEIFCAEEIIPLSWSNIFFKDRTLYGDDDTNFVDVFFRPYIDGIASDSLILIKSNVENVSDTVIYEYLIDSLVLGYQGRFIVQSIDFPAQTKDSSAIISFERPKVNVDNLEKSTYFSGERISLSGTILCYDSLALEYSYDLINWIRIADEANDEAGYSISGILPCGQFFDCLDPDLDSILYLQIVSYKSIYSDTSEILSIKLLPEVFPLVIEPCENSCPTIEFKWDLSKMTNVCDSITISYTSLNSDTFSLIAKVSAYDEHYLWNIPTNIPEWTKIRFCCENSCIRTDTVLHDIRPTYIGIVAPNPFTPPYEEVSVDYRVPKSSYVTIRIYDQANRLVKELLKSAPRQPGIVYCQKWNGQIWDGSIAANGIYYLSLELSHGEKEIYPIYIKK